jgi:hypothetical protein
MIDSITRGYYLEMGLLRLLTVGKIFHTFLINHSSIFNTNNIISIHLWEPINISNGIFMLPSIALFAVQWKNIWIFISDKHILRGRYHLTAPLAFFVLTFPGRLSICSPTQPRTLLQHSYYVSLMSRDMPWSICDYVAIIQLYYVTNSKKSSGN